MGGLIHLLGADLAQVTIHQVGDDGLPASLDSLDCVAGDGGAGSHGLQAADTAAAAAWAVNIEGNVPHLSPQSLAAQQQSAIHDDPSANACAVGDVNQVSGPLAGAEALLSQRGQIGVISYVGGQPEFLLDDSLEGYLMPARKVGSFDDYPLPGIQGTSGRNPDSLDFPKVLARCLADGLFDAPDHWLRSLLGQGEAGHPMDDISLSITERGPYLRAADINTDDVWRH